MLNLKKYTPKFYSIYSKMGNRAFKLLDIGSGNHSASKTTKLFPNCEYHGVDMDKNYGYDNQDFSSMKAFYEMDLTKLEFSPIPENYFDFISIHHVIEHLFNGDEVLVKLSSKLKSNGYMYIEYPGIRSTKLPSMYGTLNFYDDKTHVRVYSVKEISELLIRNGFKVISSGNRRNILMIVSIPFRILYTLMKREKINANIFWDLLGFAEYVFVQKN